MYDIMKEKEAIYMKEDFSDEDGIRAAELEEEYAELENKVYKTAETVNPEKKLTEKYEEKYLKWRKLYPAIKGIN